MTDRFAPRTPADIAALVAAQPLAWIVSGAPGRLAATPLPVQLEFGEDGRPLRLLGHFARSNPQWRELAQDPRASVLLLGPHGYLSPSWLRERDWGPTWNYAAAVFEVEVEIRDTPADAERLLGGLVEQLERARPAAWHERELGERRAGLSAGVVGFHARVLDVRARFKLGQDERDGVFADLLRGLAATDALELRAWMQRFGEGRALERAAAPGPAPRPIDAGVKRFIDDVIAHSRRLAAGRVLDWPARREIAELTRAPWRQGGPALARREDVVADTETGPVRLRIHDPAPGTPKPTLVYMHGGGWAMFSLDTHDRLMREYAARAGMAVVGVDYALAPEHRYPVALDQVVATVRWLRRHGTAHGLDAQRLALGGDSAGASLSFGAALKLRDAGEGDAVKAILSNYGGFSPECSTMAKLRYGTPQDMLSAAEVQEFWNTYVGHVEDRSDPYAVPLLADLRGLPPAFLVVAECDVIAEQSMALAGHLLAAEVPVQVGFYEGAPHSFIEAVAVSELANRAIDDGVAWLRERLRAAGLPKEHAA